MSQENVDVVRRGYEHRRASGDFLEEILAPDFVWDMSKFAAWPERPLYEGLEQARQFIRDWTAAFDDWGSRSRSCTTRARTRSWG